MCGVSPEKHDFYTEAGLLLADDTQSPARRPLSRLRKRPDMVSFASDLKPVLQEALEE